MSNAPRTLRLHGEDNVVVALADLAAGDVATDAALAVRTPIPAGHKLAVADIAAGAPVIKYGQVIGAATADIAAGDHVHSHNLEAGAGDGRRGLAGAPDRRPPAVGSRHFNGFRRADGRVGTRNLVAVVSTVNCSATVVRRIAGAFTEQRLGEYEAVDGVVPITHGSGCGMSARGEGLEVLRRTLVGHLAHPNVGAALVIGLGCEVNDIDGLLAAGGLQAGDTLRTLAIQDSGGTRQAIERGVAAVQELLGVANRAQREAVSTRHLVLGLQCGGSDSFSGVTANPALGRAADRLVAAGGTVVLSETPEIFGAEHLLLDRACDPAVADALRERLDWWQRYVAGQGASLDNNPSPGNLAGGITTILEKSLGAVMKSGTSPLRGVHRYAERIDGPGFVFMDGPGYDPCSVTGEIASGANLVCFTTGRGSVFGGGIAPSLKLSTTSALAARMADDIDYDCGRILGGERTLDQAGEDLFDLILATASGRRSASERNGLGDFEFVPWQLGAVL